LGNSKKPRIRAILSDWGKVVVDFDNDRVGRALQQHSSAFHDAQIVLIMFRELRELFDIYMRGQMTTSCFRKTMRLALQLTCTDDAFDRAFSDVFTPNEPVIGRWQDLRRRGVRMVAASNIEELRHAHLKELGIHDLFDAHCLSYEIGVGKPDDRFIWHALELAEVAPEEAVFVDDHEEFVQVALDLGIHGFTYDLKDHDAFERFLEGCDFAPYRPR